MRRILAYESGQVPDDIPTEPADFENDINYVTDTWLNRRLYREYPESGGYNNQDASLMRDWHKATMIYLRAKAGVFTIMPDSEPTDTFDSLTRD